MHVRSYMISAALFLGTVAAHATPLTGVYSISVSEGTGPNGGFDTANFPGYTGANTASASFTYTGPLNFSNTAADNPPSTSTPPSGDLNSTFFGSAGGAITGYTGSGTVNLNSSQVANFGTLASFLASSGSASGYAYGSLYTIDLNTLLAGTLLTITHDDGVAVFENGSRIGTTTSGPTSAVTETVTIPTTGVVTLEYARENGTPSILQVSAVTPEPSSLALLGTGLLGLAGMVRRRLA